MQEVHAKTPQAWLCLRFSYLALNSLGLAYEQAQCVVVSYQQKVWQASARAHDRGVEAGQSITQALILCPELKVIERDINKEQSLLAKLSQWAYRFTSHVHIYNEHTLLLEVGRSLKLFKGIMHLQGLVVSGLEAMQVDTQFGFAQTSKAAYVLSFQTLKAQQMTWGGASASDALRKANLQLMEVDRKTINQLLQCGFKTIGDVLAIPRIELGQRFGSAVLVYLEQLMGKQADPKVFIAPPESFRRTLDFAQPIENRTWIDQQLLRLLKELVAFVQQRQLVCQSFTWRFYHENNRLLNVTKVTLSSTQASLGTFKQLTDLKLADSDLGHAFSSIELRSESFVSKTLFNNDLFNPKPDQEAFNQLVEKLAGRLGDAALYKVFADSEHLPELANRCSTFNMVPNRVPANISPSMLMASTTEADSVEEDVVEQDEPVWLLKRPKHLSFMSKQYLQSGAINLIHGPHRLNSHWWQKLQSRDYYIARQSDGRLLWIYYEHHRKHWFLHGLFS